MADSIDSQATVNSYKRLNSHCSVAASRLIEVIDMVVILWLCSFISTKALALAFATNMNPPDAGPAVNVSGTAAGTLDDGGDSIPCAQPSPPSHAADDSSDDLDIIVTSKGSK